jgi:hypothetical protein
MNKINYSKLTSLPTITKWLSNNIQQSADRRYYHRQLEENLAIRSQILRELQSLIDKAHEDARQSLRNVTEQSVSLDPLEEEGTPGTDISIIDDFPRCLELTTLKGYFGEIMAAVVAENFNPFEEDWHVVAFPFRSHQMAYQAFEQVRQQGPPAPTIIGRFGDDMLAFQRNSHNKITHVLFCEAKCSNLHDRDLIADAHEKSSDSKIIPVDCKVLIEILKDKAQPGSNEEKWIQALQGLYLSHKKATHERCDLVNYVCGLPPVNEGTVIIPKSSPHPKYTAGRRLEAVEIHLHDVNGLIEQVYQITPQPIECTLDLTELSTLWDKVIYHLSDRHKQIIRDHCKLLSFSNNEKAVIGVRSLRVFRDIQRKISQIQEAFKEVKQVQVKIILKNISERDSVEERGLDP